MSTNENRFQPTLPEFIGTALIALGMLLPAALSKIDVEWGWLLLAATPIILGLCAIIWSARDRRKKGELVDRYTSGNDQAN